MTLAHEYNHILQFGYDAYQDAWFAESSAVWMEDEVYNDINDYLRYVRRWVKRYDTPLTANSIKEYGSAVWNKWLAHRYGRAIVRNAWARAVHTKPGGFSVAAYDSAIKAAGNSDFSRDFARFARDLPEWRTDSVFPRGRIPTPMSRVRAACRLVAASSLARSTTRPSNCFTCTPAAAGRSLSMPWLRWELRPAWPWSAEPAASATVTSSASSASSKTAVECPYTWHTQVALGGLRQSW